MRSNEEIADIVRETFSETFPPEMVSAVRVRRDVDHDGDPIFWIRLVFENGRMPFGNELTFPFGSRLWLRLVELGESAFPVLSFVTREEDDSLSAEAA